MQHALRQADILETWQYKSWYVACARMAFVAHLQPRDVQGVIFPLPQQVRASEPFLIVHADQLRHAGQCYCYRDCCQGLPDAPACKQLIEQIGAQEASFVLMGCISFTATHADVCNYTLG